MNAAVALPYDTLLQDLLAPGEIAQLKVWADRSNLPIRRVMQIALTSGLGPAGEYCERLAALPRPQVEPTQPAVGPPARGRRGGCSRDKPRLQTR